MYNYLQNCVPSPQWQGKIVTTIQFPSPPSDSLYTFVLFLFEYDLFTRLKKFSFHPILFSSKKTLRSRHVTGVGVEFQLVLCVRMRVGGGGQASHGWEIRWLSNTLCGVSDFAIYSTCPHSKVNIKTMPKASLIHFFIYPLHQYR